MRSTEPKPVIQTAAVSQADIDRAVTKAVALAVDRAHADDLQMTKTALEAVDNKYAQKQQDLIAPIQKKAVDAVQTVARENGYAYVISKDALLVSPPADDLLPLVKKKLGITK